ncbi:MAG: hypothetical protein JWN34_4963 [Bryobacterales bacterium]|nr:hypothetical protein [Bryobacterales bacterium]
MRAVVLLTVAVGLSAITAHSQETIHYASVGGRVTDPSGAVVSAAKVTATDDETKLVNRTSTNGEGRFRFPVLRPGTYDISVSGDGFATQTQRVALTVGSAFDLSVPLTIGTAETSVVIEARSDLLETSRTQIAGTVSQSEVATLPMNGRNFLDLALLVPGVSATNTGSTQLFPETSAAPGQGISIGSQRNFSNSFIVDGLSSNDDAAGLVGTFYSVAVVNEFQVVTSGGQAEFGRALGGYVSMVTKSGGNRVHGDVQGYFRNQRLNANNALLAAKLPMTQAQYTAGLGGPVVRDRTFYFASFEQRLLNQSGLITIHPANVAAINNRLATTGYSGAPIFTGLYSNPVHNINFLGKLDHRLNNRDDFSLRYSVYSVASRNSRGVGALSATTAAADLDNTDHTIAVGNVLTVSPRMVNETRGQITWSELAAEPTDPSGPAVSISGVATLGRATGSPTGRGNRLYELADNFSWQSGAHAFRAGVDFLYNDLTITYPRSVRGSYSFSSLANFLSGTYNNAGYTQTFGNPVVSQTNPNIGVYAQDEWKLTPKLTLNAGLRYDLQYLPTIATDTNNISPRLGLAWSPDASRNTVIRASFGLYYDRVPLRALANALLTRQGQVSLSLSPAQTGAPVFPNTLSSVATGVLPSYTSMDPRLQNAYSTQTSVEVERRLGRFGTVSAAYERLRGLHLIMSLNKNVPTCVAAGNNNGCRPNPSYANNSQYSAMGDSSYNALHASWIARPAKWATWRVSWDYSKAFNNVGEFFFSGPIDPSNVWRDWGRSDDDQRHRIVSAGTFQLPMKFQFSGSVQYYSALPLNPTTGQSTIQGTTARPLVAGNYIPRNAAVGFDNFGVNARLSRSFALGEHVSLEAISEAFNATNHRNNLIPNAVFGTGAYPGTPLPAYRTPAAVADPRGVQLALRLKF